MIIILVIQPFVVIGTENYRLYRAAGHLIKQRFPVRVKQVQSKPESMSSSKLGEPVLKVINKVYAPDEMISLKFGRYDLDLKTDDMGRGILLFMGKKNDKGQVIGERYARRLAENEEGRLIKDHWEHKGSAT
jgi:hypothetical protein